MIHQLLSIRTALAVLLFAGFPSIHAADIAESAAFNEVYTKHFSHPYPARSALGASGLVSNARVEMECIAGYPD